MTSLGTQEGGGRFCEDDVGREFGRLLVFVLAVVFGVGLVIVLLAVLALLLVLSLRGNGRDHFGEDDVEGPASYEQELALGEAGEDGCESSLPLETDVQVAIGLDDEVQGWATLNAKINLSSSSSSRTMPSAIRSLTSSFFCVRKM